MNFITELIMAVRTYMCRVIHSKSSHLWSLSAYELMYEFHFWAARAIG